MIINFYLITFLNEMRPLLFPLLEVIILADFNDHNHNWLANSSNTTNPSAYFAETFAIVIDLTKVISELISILDQPGNKPYTLDLFRMSNPNIYFNPTVGYPLITLQLEA